MSRLAHSMHPMPQMHGAFLWLLSPTFCPTNDDAIKVRATYL
jgi:hypothetical protein